MAQSCRDIDGQLWLRLRRHLGADEDVALRPLTDCHERVGEFVLLFGRRQLVFEREFLQRLAPLQRLVLPLALHHLLQPETYTHIWREQGQEHVTQSNGHGRTGAREQCYNTACRAAT